jgi:general secretion pathway protein B
MSYILDALKKAESERKLGSVPTMYAQAPNAIAPTDGHGWHKWLPWVLAGTTLGMLIIGLAWLQPWQSQVQTMRNVPAEAPAVTTIAPATVENPMAIAPEAAKEVKPEPAVTASSIAAPSTQRPAKPAQPTTPVLPASPVAEKVPQVATGSSVAKVASAPIREKESPNVSSEESQVGTPRDLPPNIQAELPAIVVNGYIYAKNPADRSVLINQRLLHEGDQITPELVLEKMLSKGAILNYKGYRYRVAF